MKFTKPNMGEWQLQGFIEGCFRYCGSVGWAYPSIVGSGDNATILHYKTNEDIMNSGDLVLVDAGAEYEGYAADITRTWPINGKFNAEQREIYNLVLKSQKAAIDACIVGNPCNSHHIAASGVLRDGLVKLGIIDSAAKDLDAELKKYFMHGTGHWLGLDVHDVGIYEPDGEARLYESGMVITVEPGLYFAKWREDLRDIEDKWRGIGVRIEDDVLITNNGPNILTSMCPKEINEIESLMDSIKS
jgi:Xaa-Pro aminopeptidase